MHMCPHCGEVYDRPEDDATDAAHPAWWRGHDNGAAGTAKALLRVALGEIDANGFSAPLAPAAKAIEILRAESEKWEKAYLMQFEAAGIASRRIRELEVKLAEKDDELRREIRAQDKFGI